MNKLKKKTFILLFSSITVFVATIFCIFNFTLYKKEYENISLILSKIETTHDLFFPKRGLASADKRPLFIDSIIYVVTFDTNLEVSQIINYSDTGLSDEEIKSMALYYIANNNFNKTKINLYFNTYSYAYKNSNLFIIDNTTNSNRLKSSLASSILLFIILEMVIAFIVTNITKWLVKPVEESFEKQKQFIYDASHELKTPLAVIIASAETLEENPEEKKWLDTIQSEAERMNKLVVDLLELAKSEREIKEEYSKNNLSKIVEIGALPFESLIFEKGLKLNLEIESDIEYACNPERIKELLGILLDNAIKHSLDDAKITVSLKKDNNSIILEVINRGEEIPKEEREKIFERFYRSDASRNRNENRYGLGLAIAKNIVTNHRGIIKVNCLNGYTSFKVTFRV